MGGMTVAPALRHGRSVRCQSTNAPSVSGVRSSVSCPAPDLHESRSTDVPQLSVSERHAVVPRDAASLFNKAGASVRLSHKLHSTVQRHRTSTPEREDR